ncbi:F0F1 ATP synthase subunit epsilon [Mesosutterella sp. OilRF-GAM-744-9]|uniref:ATP synthase epsilon chain n=1 Tax=Mesosutterella porci TaxID=2915351 RepID=A0ABS9MNH0_9BURK|nr:F0F1 ATP synthase subunit epsilon [Mesosutterella sp. oilRF-744-WT-GAM-9]MCG5030166.1 F0F1 ATP synthase subunit epsilon [Mesosutterella sp. oilRF-744-WT-GAM-9]
MKTIRVDVVNAEKHIFSGDAKFVALPGVEGELGVLPGHVPFITRIKPGFVRVTMPDDPEVKRIFVAGGILEVQPDIVTVLADTAVRSEDLDEAKAKKALEETKELRKNAKGDLEIARLEAEMLALSAELKIIQKLSAKR